jgi:hypothetical protein
MTTDTTLRILMELAVTSIDRNRPVFPRLLDEPVLWKKFLVAVINAREAARAAKAELNKMIPDMPKI